VGNERFRWMEAHPPAWHYMKYYRYMEKYGAVCIGSQYTNGMAGEQLEVKPDGSVDLRDRLLYPEDMPLVTREDAMRFAFGPDARTPVEMKQDEYIRPNSLQEFAIIYHCDGAILPIWRHGVGCTMIRKEQGRSLTEIGVNVLHYEGSQPGDRTDLDEKHLLDQLDAWMESQGLEKLED
jgi:benzoyl-CoA reductase subunit B